MKKVIENQTVCITEVIRAALSGHVRPATRLWRAEEEILR
jgi:hypothetical protein